LATDASCTGPERRYFEEKGAMGNLTDLKAFIRNILTEKAPNCHD
jgi:hypothetical protein